jgi:nicotinic acid mononucleotide adenylyltransferase
MLVNEEDKKDKDKKRMSFKEFDPSKYVNLEPTLDEAAKGTAVVSWGRMNPMTAGHEKLVKKVLSVAKAEKGMPHIFLTHSVDKKKNPLTYEDKLNFAQKAFGPVVKNSNAKTIFQLMKQLEKGFNRVVFVAGSDRVKEFNDTLNKYNGKEYKFDEIKVVSAGQRDEDADDVSGISGTKMRGYAATDMKKFAANLPKKIRGDAEEIAALVRKGMNLNESLEELDEILTRQQRHKKSIAMRRARHKIKRGRELAKRKLASNEKLQGRARKKAIETLKNKYAKHKRYADMETAEKINIEKKIQKLPKARIDALAKRLLPKVKQAERERFANKATDNPTTPKRESVMPSFKDFLNEKIKVKQDRDIDDMPGSQPAGYYKGVDKDKKDDRARHFANKAKMDDDDPKAYTPAPGDKEAKTKPSTFTKKYKAMYGEENLDEMWGTNVSKRPHMLMDKNLKTKFDKRFKMYKRPEETPVEKELEESLFQESVDLMDLMDLIESTEILIDDLNEDAETGLKKKAEKSGMPYGILKKVYDRGMAAWKTGHRPGTTPQQWGMARVNSFVTKSSGTWGKADSDLAAKVRKEEVEQLDEVLPAIAGAIARKAAGAVAKKVAKKAAVAVGKAVATGAAIGVAKKVASKVADSGKKEKEESSDYEKARRKAIRNNVNTEPTVDENLATKDTPNA